MDSGEFVGIVLFLCVFGSIAVVAYFRQNAKLATQETLRKAIDQGQTLSEEMVRALSGYVVPSAVRDLRRGMVLIAVALAAFGFGLLLDDEDASVVFYGAGLLPLFVGVAFVIMHRIGSRGAS